MERYQMLLIISGIVMIIIGLLLSSYATTETYFWGMMNTTDKPYASYLVPFSLSGLILIIAGIIPPRK